MPIHLRAPVDIDAPLERVWAVMLDTDAHAEWNRSSSGSTRRHRSRWGPDPLPARWANGRGATSLDGSASSSRFARTVTGGPTCDDTVEELTGTLVRLAGPARVQDDFRRHAAALKHRCETGPHLG